jgi:hypothetical protein
MNETVITAEPPAHTTLSRRPKASFGLSAFFSTGTTGAAACLPSSGFASSFD